MELIRVENRRIGETEVNSVNLRDVHAFVGSKQRFADWVSDRLRDFSKSLDYLEHKIMTQYNQVDRIDYIVTLDTAKHICMILPHSLRIRCEKLRTEKGSSKLSSTDYNYLLIYVTY